MLRNEDLDVVKARINLTNSQRILEMDEEGGLITGQMILEENIGSEEAKRKVESLLDLSERKT